MLNQLIKLQKFYLYKKFLKSVRNNIDLIKELMSYENKIEEIHLFDHENHREKLFDSLKKLIIKKENINGLNDMLSNLYNYYKVNILIAPPITPQKLLSAWIIVNFPEYILGKQKKDLTDQYSYPDDIYIITKTFIDNFNKLLVCPFDNDTKRCFFKSFNKYSNAITYFLERDKLHQLNKLINEYHEINNTINMLILDNKMEPSDKTKCLDEIKKTKSNITSYILKLDKSIKIDEIELQSNLHILKEKKIEELNYTILVNDVKTKKLVFFTSFLSQIKNDLIKINAKKTLTGKNIDDVIDVDLISKSIMYTDLSYESIKKYGDYFVQIINELQASSQISTTVELWNKLNDEPNSSIDFLIKMLFLIFNEIKKIYENIQTINTLNSVGINVFELQ